MALENGDDEPLSPRESALVEFARKLTNAASAIDMSDLGILLAQGLDDEAVLHVVQIISYYNFVNRLALGLGVQLESSAE